MNLINLQQTLKFPIQLKGVGVHSGKDSILNIKPGPINSGIIFVRTDLEGRPEILGHYSKIVNTQMATTLGQGRATVSTVEHVLAALQGLGVDNALIEVDGPEIPIMDGSSHPFCEAILDAGLETQRATRAKLILTRKVEVKIGEKWAAAGPSERLEIQGSIEWDHPAIGHQDFHYIEGKTSFTELSRARTFGFLKEVEMLKQMGLARGGSLENAVVLNEAKILNPEGLRFADEFVRHKVLDALGDFKLAGYALQAHFRLHRAGHDLHCQLLNEIFKDPNNFEIMDSVTAEEKVRPAAALRPVAAGGNGGWAAAL
ncbi:UDP-3-O-acyl-N-acetylglucosamine deacetylase [bacterium]|nr:UDP-3-O-acyl-N-acetylglucosamine deacetylase [bacterium]